MKKNRSAEPLGITITPLQLRDAQGNLLPLTDTHRQLILSELGAQGAPTGKQTVSIPEYNKAQLNATVFGLPQGIPMPVKRGSMALCHYDTAAIAPSLVEGRRPLQTTRPTQPTRKWIHGDSALCFTPWCRVLRAPLLPRSCLKPSA